MRVSRAALRLSVYWSGVQTSLSRLCLRLSQVVSAPLETGAVSLHLKRMGMTTNAALLGLAATVALSTAPVQAQVSFLPPQTFATADGPRSIVVGDLDGDGDLDLATVNIGGSYPDFVNTVSVLKNNGNGTFANAQTLAVGDYPTSITVGDLDGDGDLDLATVNIGDYVYPGFQSTVSVLRNNGNGTFAAAQSFTTGKSAFEITIGDIDGDGDLDLVTTYGAGYTNSRYVGYVTVLKNNGNGTFAEPQDFPSGAYPTSITIGDLDGDGDLDLAIANNSGFRYFFSYLTVLKNDGNGNFGGRQDFGASLAFDIEAGDLDGDGDLDLATANTSNVYNGFSTGSVTVFKNGGDGTFRGQTFYIGDSYPSNDGTYSLTIGDLDGDGDLDVAAANSRSNTVSVLKNNGDGTLATPQDFANEGGPNSIAVGDLDEDGDLDLATTSPSSDTVATLQSTTPTLQLSLSPDRSNPVPLAGQTVSGDVYVFASGKDADFLRVRFFIDDPDRSGESFRTELAAPFDLSGASGSKANPSDSRALTNGTHTITATFARTDGTFRTITSTFTVNN
ncbi:MAG: VCBS repeat-containing protein [Gemmatimonadaceae bacterium]|nr:VCBS repeat-containing protein [Gloeobacterales cyanobacterium ES-bin-141]